MINSEELVTLCAGDSELLLAARYWTGGLRIGIGDASVEIVFDDGRPIPGPIRGEDGVVELSAPPSVWERILAVEPPRFYNDIAPAQGVGLRRRGGDVVYWQYYPAVARVIELLRAASPVQLTETRHPQTFDCPVGRYFNLDLDGHLYRIYMEEAGSGIPLLLHHTAGSSSLQWRHLFEEPSITDHFRLIAFDLPFHGKSLPPTTQKWWSEEYKLTRDQVLALPRALATALGLDRPVFMGCSVGGQVALDLARYHPGEFRAVVSLEPALKLEVNPKSLPGLWHPQVNNEMKARMMLGLTSPTAPEAYRRETTFAYSAAWPPAFLGDLNYYFYDHDLTDGAAAIDTSATAVHLLVGEYDWSASIEHAQAVHRAVPGSTLAVMEGLGHFPMCEDPKRFLTYLLPVLEQIQSAAGTS